MPQHNSAASNHVSSHAAKETAAAVGKEAAKSGAAVPPPSNVPFWQVRMKAVRFSCVRPSLHRQHLKIPLAAGMDSAAEPAERQGAFGCGDMDGRPAEGLHKL